MGYPHDEPSGSRAKPEVCVVQMTPPAVVEKSWVQAARLPL